jgi:Rieske Fe-S protein
LQQEAVLAAKLGFDVRYLDRGPIKGLPAIEFTNQALFHPLKYVSALAEAVDGDGSVVREAAEVGGALQDPRAVIVNGETVACTDIVIATHVPLMGNSGLLAATLLQTKLYPYSTYVLGARLTGGAIPIGLYWDIADPYEYLRIHEGENGLYAIFGGEDHKTGHESNTERRFQALVASFHSLIPSAHIDRNWTGQVIETDDGLPFIGQTAEHQFVATGFAGNGLTFGSVSAMMIRDAIVGNANPCRELFDPHRKASSAGALGRIVEENADYPIYMVTDRVRRVFDRADVDSIGRGEGKVLSMGGKRVACSRSDDGQLIQVSAVCTHMGCLVRWNRADSTWDCPCHGSRFTSEGLVMGGPAEAPLERFDND